MTKVSIIVPCFNVEKYLDRCIRSIVNQTLRDIEIILIDDLSPDGTPRLCDEWAKKDSRIKVIHKEINQGLGMARNTGLEKATGEYISFVDSDDWFELDMMERLYNECIQEQLDVIYSEFNVDEYPGYRIILRPEHLFTGKEEIEKLRLDIVGAEPSFISGIKFQCSACKGLYRRNLIESFNITFLSEREYISEDMLFNLEVLYHAIRVKTVPWQFYHYCLNGSSLSHSYRPDRWEKQVKMLKVLNDPDKYSDSKELSLRIGRTAIFYTMAAIVNEKKRANKTKKEILIAIKEIAQNPILCEYIKGYPILKLPIKWFIYTIALKLRLQRILYQLVRF